ncbi:MAG: hypothetical protein JNK11_02250 [Alphaproteobacteria bacterium]|nr:hypothetical protein [Alphaproteobacteria bacterium]
MRKPKSPKAPPPWRRPDAVARSLTSPLFRQRVKAAATAKQQRLQARRRLRGGDETASVRALRAGRCSLVARALPGLAAP